MTIADGRGMRPGDRVVLKIDGVAHPAVIRQTRSWQYLLAQTEDGRLWLDVVFNISAAEWTRLVELDDSVDPADEPAIAAMAEALAWQPKRKGVSDVPGAKRLCEIGTSLEWL